MATPTCVWLRCWHTWLRAQPLLHVLACGAGPMAGGWWLHTVSAPQGSERPPREGLPWTRPEVRPWRLPRLCAKREALSSALRPRNSLLKRALCGSAGSPATGPLHAASFGVCVSDRLLSPSVTKSLLSVGWPRGAAPPRPLLTCMGLFCVPTSCCLGCLLLLLF